MHAVDRMAVESERRAAAADPDRPANYRPMADGSAMKGRSIAADGAVDGLSISADGSVDGLSISADRSVKGLSIASDRSTGSDMLRGGARRRTFVAVTTALSELRNRQCRGREHQCRGNG